MKIFRIAAPQMMPPAPGAPTTESLAIQIQNFQNALPLLQKFTEVANQATQASELANQVGETLGVTGLGNQIMNEMKTAIGNSNDFKSLVQINALGSVDELFNSGNMSTRITKMTQQLQDAQQSQAQLANPQNQQGNQ